jgi:hypothetical protein
VGRNGLIYRYVRRSVTIINNDILVIKDNILSTVGDSCATIHDDREGTMMAKAISEKALMAIDQANPLRAIFRDSGFVPASAKINIFDIFNLHAPNTKTKVI